MCCADSELDGTGKRSAVRPTKGKQGKTGCWKKNKMWKWKKLLLYEIDGITHSSSCYWMDLFYWSLCDEFRRMFFFKYTRILYQAEWTQNYFADTSKPAASFCSGAQALGGSTQGTSGTKGLVRRPHHGWSISLTPHRKQTQVVDRSTSIFVCRYEKAKLLRLCKQCDNNTTQRKKHFFIPFLFIHVFRGAQMASHSDSESDQIRQNETCKPQIQSIFRNSYSIIKSKTFGVCLEGLQIWRSQESWAKCGIQKLNQW